ncbi:MAG: serine/threonine-protein kinase, partial [Planctomycetota bacterium]
MSDRSETLSLMQTIQRDGELRDWLASQPADRKTVTLSVGGGSKQFSHPDRNETMLWHPPTHAADNGSEPDAGVPTRQLQNLHSDDRQAAEYRLVGQLGAGGTGVVYQAHQRAVDREVAIKTLRQEIATDPISRTRFLSEARVIGALDHPNVIALHELGVDQSGSLFYSMKRIDGTSWDKRIESMSVAANVKTLLQVADAIRYAHSQGFVHRDIKPENVMLGRFGEVLLADWGLALQPALPERLMMTEAAIGGTYGRIESRRPNAALSSGANESDSHTYLFHV